MKEIIEQGLKMCFKRSLSKRERFTIRFAEIEDTTGFKLSTILRYLEELKTLGVLLGYYPAISRMHFVKGRNFYTWIINS